MPLGIQRYNQRHKHPNDRIVFIKPLPGPDQAISKDFLERVAAICVPIMKSAAISVMTLEEYEPNREFLGRNFNAGEVIQLVLKSKYGRWLPFNFVQMVMMHELAHCLQMNHGRQFWTVNNQFRDELKALWQRGYTGEGIWGQGRSLYNGQIANDTAPSQGEIPQALCGGTYRSRRRKRKRGQTGPDRVSSDLTYAERKQWRIARKFGQGGSSLGGDEDTRILLEKGKAAGKPRVAKSKRGRELAAAAALLRFEQNKNTSSSSPRQGEDSDASDSDASTTDAESDCAGIDPDLEVKSQGKSFIKICDADDGIGNSDYAIDELRDLQLLSQLRPRRASPTKDDNTGVSTTDEGSDHESARCLGRSSSAAISAERVPGPSLAQHQIDAASPLHSRSEKRSAKPLADESSKSYAPSAHTVSIGSVAHNPPASFNAPNSRSDSPPFRFPSPSPDSSAISNANIDQKLESTSTALTPAEECRVCSLANEPHAVVCAACANVLDPRRLPMHWRCDKDACVQVGYVNSADAGVCGLCGERKPSGRQKQTVML